MKVVLIQDVAHLGRKGQLVEVANGYGANFLIPNKKALKADTAHAQLFINKVEAAGNQKARSAEENVARAQKLIGEQFDLQVEANEVGGLFGSLNESKVAELISLITGESVDPKNLKLRNGAIKEVGEHDLLIVDSKKELGSAMLNVTSTV
jgi:large subunit ribosomal protein L9